jgi:hypothetical protein
MELIQMLYRVSLSQNDVDGKIWSPNPKFFFIDSVILSRDKSFQSFLWSSCAPPKVEVNF